MGETFPSSTQLKEEGAPVKSIKSSLLSS